MDYNATTGAVIKQHTSQGYADSSTWSRGQSWGIYGFANSTSSFRPCFVLSVTLDVVYKHTQNITYLETSRRMAAYFINNLPSNGVVPWCAGVIPSKR